MDHKFFSVHCVSCSTGNVTKGNGLLGETSEPAFLSTDGAITAPGTDALARGTASRGQLGQSVKGESEVASEAGPV